MLRYCSGDLASRPGRWRFRSFRVSSRDIPGYPNVEQIRYYLFYPGAVLMIVLGAWFFAANRPMRGFFAVGVALGSLVLFPFYFFYFTGGV